MGSKDLKTLLLKLFNGRCNFPVNLGFNPFLRTHCGPRVWTKIPGIINSMYPMNANGITGTKDGRKVLSLVNQVSNDRQIRLAAVQHLLNFLKALWRHYLACLIEERIDKSYKL